MVGVICYGEAGGCDRRFAGRSGLNADAVADGLGSGGRGQVHRVGGRRGHGLGRRVGGGFLLFLLAWAAAGDQQGSLVGRRHGQGNYGTSREYETAKQLLFLFASPE
jgi:hypothetical protein